MEELQDILDAAYCAEVRPIDEVGDQIRNNIGRAFCQAINDLGNMTMAERIYFQSLLSRLHREVTTSINNHQENL